MTDPAAQASQKSAILALTVMCQNVRGVSDEKKNGAPPTTSGPGYAASLKHCLCNLVFMQERIKRRI